MKPLNRDRSQFGQHRLYLARHTGIRGPPLIQARHCIDQYI
jgi:hypothetical protein